MPVAHTGPDKLLVVGISVIPEVDLHQARATARRSPLLQRPGSPQPRAVGPFGYWADEIASASGRLVNDTHALGAPAQIAARFREHLDTGADHVIAYPATFIVTTSM